MQLKDKIIFLRILVFPLLIFSTPIKTNLINPLNPDKVNKQSSGQNLQKFQYKRKRDS